ncbi:hypothetical protein C8J57DRAFT_1237844 [Mycena rebaudengoi]|nr:hypothetical protein C8J57DRAFT_1237844 [Mycena rebaudengoi]
MCKKNFEQTFTGGTGKVSTIDGKPQRLDTRAGYPQPDYQQRAPQSQGPLLAWSQDESEEYFDPELQREVIEAHREIELSCQLLFGPSIVVVISGPHIQLVDPRTGDLITTTSDLQGPDQEALRLKSGPVRLAAIDNSGTHLVTSGDDKAAESFGKLLNERSLISVPLQPSI